jgi:MATE family multidrug resistance protein
LGSILGLSMNQGGLYIARFYTNIDSVADEAASLFQFVALFMFIDVQQCISCGVLRGLGKTVHATVVSATAYYLISIPIQLLLSFYWRMGLFGLWLGQTIGCSFQVLLNQYLVSWHFGDWKELAREARERMQAE